MRIYIPGSLSPPLESLGTRLWSDWQMLLWYTMSMIFKIPVETLYFWRRLAPHRWFVSTLVLYTSRWARFAHPLLHDIILWTDTRTTTIDNYMHADVGSGCLHLHAFNCQQAKCVKEQILQACRGHNVYSREWLKSIEYVNSTRKKLHCRIVRACAFAASCLSTWINSLVSLLAV